jgi:zinc transport system substrate-binding protein
MRDLAAAKAWILSGTDFEIGLEPKIAAQFPDLTIVDGTAGVTFRQLQDWEHELGEEDHDDPSGHAEDAGESHSHAGNIDRHSWLGSGPAKILAGHIRDTLIAVDPEGAGLYSKNHDEFVREIDEVYGSLRASLAPLSGKKVLVFHPAFGYFLDEFGIRQESVETGGKEPTARALAELIAKAKAEKPGAIFVQAQFPVTAAQTVAREVGASVVALDPLDADWLGNITRMGEALIKELE